MTPIPDEIVSFFRDVLQCDGFDLTTDTNPDDLLGWDSLNHIALMVETECRFGVSFEPHDIEAVHRVGDLIDILHAKQAL